MSKLKVGLIGVGFIGPVHLEALSRIHGNEVVAIADVNQTAARAVAERSGVPDVYGDYRELLADPQIDVVHNCTPNHLHFEVNKAIIEAGKHVVSEKPLATSEADAAALLALAREAGVVHAVCFGYRFFPLIQHARARIAEGDLGRLFAVQGRYVQDWLLYETDWNWRLDPKFAGPSRAIADIGSHVLDLAQFVTGNRIVRVMADLMTVHPVRKRPTKPSAETFGGTGERPAEFEAVEISTEDQGHVLVEFSDGSRGLFCVSQISAGRKNHVGLEIQGARQAFWWDQERPNELHVGHRDRAGELLLKDPALLDPAAREYAHYPGGHNEGYPTCMKNLVRNVYRHIADRDHPVDFPTFEDGTQIEAVVEAILESHRTRQWVDVSIAGQA